MKKALMIASVLIIAVVSTACINNIAVQELNNKAAEYMQKGDYESAINRLQASLDLDATMYETYYNLGVAAINANKYETAVEALEGGIKIKPEYAEFYYSLGVAQSALADEILEGKAVEEQDISKDDSNIEASNGSVLIEDRMKAMTLKHDAVLNLKKYLEMSPSTEDKEVIESLIKECDSVLNENQKAVE